ncbi:antirestriction protein ArdA [Streptomyces sp. BI20]|uniref:antirestriction protein ArdA n=1 Tax=Streptomyces sp. BI20 TaxID=3403460 RepID=UPI003C743AC2
MIQIYVADLSAYNAGILHGEWIDATEDPDSIRDAITVMLEESPIPGAEEYAIHDTDGFGGVRVGEYDDIDDVHEIARTLDDFPAAVVAHIYIDNPDVSTLYDLCEEMFMGTVTEELDGEQALAAFIVEEEPDFFDGLPKHLETHGGAIARSEARDRICGGAVHPVYEGAGVWHMVRSV